MKISTAIPLSDSCERLPSVPKVPLLGYQLELPEEEQADRTAVPLLAQGQALPVCAQLHCLLVAVTGSSRGISQGQQACQLTSQTSHLQLSCSVRAEEHAVALLWLLFIEEGGH